MSLHYKDKLIFVEKRDLDENNKREIISKKIELIGTLIKDIEVKKNKYYKRFKKLKRRTILSNMFINGLNGISICSLVLALTPMSIAFSIIALTTTSISGLINALVTSSNIESKYHSDNTSYLQYTDLFRSTSSILLKNHLESMDYDRLLVSLNEKM